jgi:hypothetical protein
MRLPTPRALRVPLVLVFAAVFAAAGCAKPTPTGGGQTQPPTTAATTSGTGSTGGTPTSTPPAAGGEYKVTYGWAVPSQKVTVTNKVTVPIAPPPSPPLPYLVGIYVGNHPEASPKYQRISFYFRGAFPSYNLQYVREVLSEGQGTPISLEGNAFLNIQFVEAQGHDNSGNSTIKDVAKQHIGFHNLISYAPGGDFEGYMTFGLGIQTAKNSDQVIPIRVGELKKPDGAGGFLYVVAFDVQNA